MSIASVTPSRWAVGLVALSLLACQPSKAGTAGTGRNQPGTGGSAGVDLVAAARAVRSADSAFAAAAAAHDLEGSVAGLAADGIMFPPDKPPVIGRAAIRAYMRESFAIPHFSVSWTTDTVVVAASGDLAYSFARSRYTFPGRSGAPGAVDTAYGKGVSVWRREADGRWRQTADIWNGAPTLPAIRPTDASN
jgi:ketosteroid isomerase-like protein